MQVTACWERPRWAGAGSCTAPKGAAIPHVAKQANGPDVARSLQEKTGSVFLIHNPSEPEMLAMNLRNSEDALGANQMRLCAGSGLPAATLSLGSASLRVPPHCDISHSLAYAMPPHTEEASDTSCWTEFQTPHVCEAQGHCPGNAAHSTQPTP